MRWAFSENNWMGHYTGPWPSSDESLQHCTDLCWILKSMYWSITRHQNYSLCHKHCELCMVVHNTHYDCTWHEPWMTDVKMRVNLTQSCLCLEGVICQILRVFYCFHNCNNQLTSPYDQECKNTVIYQEKYHMKCDQWICHLSTWQTHEVNNWMGAIIPECCPRISTSIHLSGMKFGQNEEHTYWRRINSIEGDFVRYPANILIFFTDVRLGATPRHDYVTCSCKVSREEDSTKIKIT